MPLTYSAKGIDGDDHVYARCLWLRLKLPNKSTSGSHLLAPSCADELRLCE